MFYKSGFLLFTVLTLIGVYSTTAATAASHDQAIDFYIFPKGLAHADKGDDAVEAYLTEIQKKVGKSSSRGTVGIALVHPYTAFVEGTGPNNFKMRENIKPQYETIIRVAKKLKMPVMVGFNGANWASPEGPFNDYWKTQDGGKYLTRYNDGQVNASIKKTGSIDREDLLPYLHVNPYQKDKAADSLFLTNSSFAKPLVKSRLSVLMSALRFWKEMDEKYPDVIKAFNTDSEVSDFSFREGADGSFIPIGYEEFLTTPYCEHYSIHDCANYFKHHKFTYRTEEDQRWFFYRAAIHRGFVNDTVKTIREVFASQKVYTHQLVTLDRQFIFNYKNHDFASPQGTAVVEGANPGMTYFINNKHDQDFKKIIQEFSVKAQAKNKYFGLMEFNPGKTWSGSREELSQYTREIIGFLRDQGADSIAFLSWESNSLDKGIKDSGVDDGIKAYLESAD